MASVDLRQVVQVMSTQNAQISTDLAVMTVRAEQAERAHREALRDLAAERSAATPDTIDLDTPDPAGA